MFWNSHKLMAVVYLVGLWDGKESPAFIVGQIVMGALGLARELSLKRRGFSEET